MSALQNVIDIQKEINKLLLISSSDYAEMGRVIDNVFVRYTYAISLLSPEERYHWNKLSKE